MFDFSIEKMLLTIPAILIGFSFHEFAHALVSDKLGDPTPRNQGRLTISPFAHIDILGFIMIIIMGFGWAKPVQINPSYYKHPKRDKLLVSIAGPITNFLMAFIFMIAIRIISDNYVLNSEILNNLLKILTYVVWINIILGFFNLIPIPPLDGFNILAELLPSRSYKVIGFLERYGTILLIILIISPAASYIIGTPANFIYNLMFKAVGL